MDDLQDDLHGEIQTEYSNAIPVPVEPECVYNVEEKVGLDDFLADFIPAGDKITVDANWLQTKLKDMYRMEINEKQMLKEKQALNGNLSILKSRIDTLNTTVDIMKIDRKPKIEVRRVLDVYI